MLAISTLLGVWKSEEVLLLVFELLLTKCTSVLPLQTTTLCIQVCICETTLPTSYCVKLSVTCSFLAIRLDWEVYNIDEDDDQLIDLIIDVGDPHPKIVNGKEIVTARQSSLDSLVTVRVREHIGKQKNVPFSIKQSQQVSWQIIWNMKLSQLSR